LNVEGLRRTVLYGNQATPRALAGPCGPCLRRTVLYGNFLTTTLP